MFTLTWPIRMARAGTARKRADIVELVSTIYTIEIRHIVICYKSFIAIYAQASASASA